MCLPAGARLGSNWLCCTTSTKGRSGCSPRHTAASAAAISSSVPPTCTVDGVEAARIAPRDRPVERPVELEHARAVAIAAQPAHVARGQDRLADVGELRRAGVEEDDARRRNVGEACARARRSRSGRRAGADTRRAPRRWPASRRRRPASPRRAPVSAKIMATAAVSGRSSGRIECAAQPASSARARAPRKRARSATRRGQQPGQPEARHRERMPRQAQRAEEIGEQRVRLAQERREEPSCRRRASSPSSRAVSSSERRSSTAGSSSSGCATDAGGWIQRRPCAASGSVRKNGERIAHRMTAGADVVREAGQRQLGGARAAADLVAGLEDPHRRAAARQLDRRGESVRAGADDDGVVHLLRPRRSPRARAGRARRAAT